uniref:Putative secreted protein n=1 Tax=Anopheles marajoara TaxID=58244 RepID=A0A2M4C858_9DIPT
MANARLVAYLLAWHPPGEATIRPTRSSVSTGCHIFHRNTRRVSNGLPAAGQTVDGTERVFAHTRNPRAARCHGNIREGVASGAWSKFASSHALHTILDGSRHLTAV